MTSQIVTPGPQVTQYSSIESRERSVIASFVAGCQEEIEPLALSHADLIAPGLTVALCTYCRADNVTAFFDSLLSQDRRPDRVVVVDASPDTRTEEVVREMAGRTVPHPCLIYVRVSGDLKGLTVQRNFALRLVSTDLVAFFDDDVLLLPGCLRELEAAYRSYPGRVAGVGAYVMNQKPSGSLALLWRIRRILWMVPGLRPGAYYRSGMSVPWGFLSPNENTVEGDWLQGCAMMWDTALARSMRFNEAFKGYSNGEDLEFSLRMGTRGKLLIAGKAKVLHNRDGSGRPDAYQMGYMNLRNAHYIHVHCLPRRTRLDGAWFVYAFGIDTFIRTAGLLRPGTPKAVGDHLRGRWQFFGELLRPGSNAEAGDMVPPRMRIEPRRPGLE